MRMKCSLLALILCVGMCSAAQATLELEFTYALPRDTPAASYNAALFHFDDFTRQTFVNCIGRVAGESSGMIISGDFTIIFNADNTATLNWNLVDADHNFLGVYVAGGDGGGNLYENVSEMEGDEIRGTATIEASANGNGTLAGISHIDFFCGRNEAVPDQGATVILLSSALAGLALFRRAAAL